MNAAPRRRTQRYGDDRRRPPLRAPRGPHRLRGPHRHPAPRALPLSRRRGGRARGHPPPGRGRHRRPRRHRPLPRPPAARGDRRPRLPRDPGGPRSTSRARRRSQAAQRELAEEIGKAAEHWEHLTDYVSSVGVMDEVVHVYLATGLSDAHAEAEDNERIEIVRWPLADLDGAIAATRDAKTLIGLLWLKRAARRAPERAAPRAARAVAAARTAARGGEDQRDMAVSATTCPRPTSPAIADGGMSGRMLDFLAYLEFERGLSRNTLEAYRSDLLQFGAFLGPPGRRRRRRPSTPTSAPSWPSWRRAARAARRSRPATLQRKAACLRSFYRHLRREGVLDRDPTADLRAPRKSQRLPQVLSRDEVARLLGAPQGHRPGGAARPRAARAHVRLRPARLGGDRPRRARRRPHARRAARPRQGLQGAPGPDRPRGASRPRGSTSSAAGRRSSASATRRTCSSTAAAAA